MAMFTLTLIRHGETIANKERVIQGQQDWDLSDKGVHQAELLSMRLQHERFTHVFASDLTRAYKTCQIVLAQNQPNCSQIIQDSRLRERKFGVFEGRSSKEFLEAMRKIKQLHKREYAPQGGESMLQVRQRAVLFFQELCHKLKQCIDKEPTQTEERQAECSSGIKRARHTSSSSSFTGSEDSIVCKPADTRTLETRKQETDVACSHSHSGSTSGYSSLGESGDHLHLPPEATGGIVPSASSDRLEPCPHRGRPLTLEYMQADSPRNLGNEEWDDDDDCNDNGNPGSGSDAVFTSQASIEEDFIQSHIRGAQNLQYGCPNVSLSPLFGHRLSSISTISSGRNSFDDTDSIPPLLAEALCVTHGGVIKELILYFIEELGCRLPGGRSLASCVSPNTGISKFAVTLDNGEKPQVTCLSIHDKDHLIGSGIDALD